MKRNFNRLANFLSLHCRSAKQHQFLPQRHGSSCDPGCQRARWPWRWNGGAWEQPGRSHWGEVGWRWHRGAREQPGSSHWGDVGPRGKGAVPAEKLQLRHHLSIWQADEGSLHGWPQHLWDSAGRRQLDASCIGEFRVFRRWGRGFLAKGAAGGGTREVPAAGTEKENGRRTWKTTPEERLSLVPLWFILRSTVLGFPGAMDVFGPRRRGLRSAAVLSSGAVAGWPVLLQHSCSDCWSHMFRWQLRCWPPQTAVGILWKLRLLLPGKPYCDHSHREVCDGWILVDYAGSWAAVLLHVYFNVSVVLVHLLRGEYRKCWEAGREGSCQSDHSVSRQSSSRHRQVCLLMARQVRVCLGRTGHRQPQWRHQCSGGLSPRGFRAFRQPRRYPQRGKATGQLLVRSPLWGAEAVGLPLVDKVDCKHRKCTQGRRWNGGVFLQRQEG